MPKCRNCVVRNEHCETSDPRDPEGGLTVRSVAAKSVHDRDAWRAPSLSGEGRRRQSGSGSRSEERTALRTFQTRLTAETQPRDAEGDIPWVSRAYQASIEENQCESLGGSTPDVVINTDDTAAYRVKVSPIRAGTRAVASADPAASCSSLGGAAYSPYAASSICTSRPRASSPSAHSSGMGCTTVRNSSCRSSPLFPFFPHETKLRDTQRCFLRGCGRSSLS